MKFKNLIQYRHSFETHFFNFVSGKITLEEMILKLKAIEDHHRQLTKNFKAEIWFKFGYSDSLATDINDLKNDLIIGNKNYDFTVERLTKAYELQGTELLIYFS